MVLASTLGANLLAACAADNNEPNSSQVGGTLKTFNWAGYEDKEIAGRSCVRTT